MGPQFTLSIAPVALLALLTACGGGGGGGGGGGNGVSSGPPDVVAPTVTAMTPAEDLSDIPINSKLTATFSEAMIATAIGTGNFRLTDGVSSIAGTVSYDATNHIAVFTPTGGLAPSTRYTATIVTGIKDLAGNPLTTDFAWCFVTAVSAFATAPGVTITVPAGAATNVAMNSEVSATFSQDMDAPTIAAGRFTVAENGVTPVSGRVTYFGRTATFAPTRELASNTTYTATITTGVVSLAGVASDANVTWSFTTGTHVDVTAPVGTIPVSAESGVKKRIDVVFSEPMNPATFTTASFTVTGPGAAPVIGTVALDTASNTATFTRINHLTTPVISHPSPVSDLEPNTTYTATLTTGVTDTVGTALTGNLVWSFTTAP